MDDDDICSRVAVKALQRHTSDIISDSGISSTNLANDLFSSQALEERDYKEITDRYSGKTDYERKKLILDHIREKVRYSPSNFSEFLTVLQYQGINGRVLTERLKRTYQGHVTTVQWEVLIRL